jgi:hypothetical protein
MKRVAIVVAVLALVLAACQSISENIAENITEKALEGVDGVDGVNIDTDSGQVSIETEEGSVTIGGGQMPDGFAIPAPDGYAVTSVFESDESASVSLAYADGNFDAIVAFYDDWTASQSSEWSKSSSSISTEEGSLDSANWSSAEGVGFIAISNQCLVFDDSIDTDNCVGVNLNTGG